MKGREWFIMVRRRHSRECRRYPSSNVINITQNVNKATSILITTICPICYMMVAGLRMVLYSFDLWRLEKFGAPELWVLISAFYF